LLTKKQKTAFKLKRPYCGAIKAQLQFINFAISPQLSNVLYSYIRSRHHYRWRWLYF